MSKADIDSKDPEYAVGVDEVVADDDSYSELRGWRKVRPDFPPRARRLAGPVPFGPSLVG